LTENSKSVEPFRRRCVTLAGVMPKRIPERVLSRSEAGLTREAIPPGAARLVAELALRGLNREALREAALLAVALDENATSSSASERAAA
jgi:hypothetical protein